MVLQKAVDSTSNGILLKLWYINVDTEILRYRIDDKFMYPEIFLVSLALKSGILENALKIYSEEINKLLECKKKDCRILVLHVKYLVKGKKSTLLAYIVLDIGKACSALRIMNDGF